MTATNQENLRAPRADTAAAGRGLRRPEHANPGPSLRRNGRMRPSRRDVIDRLYPLADTVAALRRLMDGPARGKLVIGASLTHQPTSDSGSPA